MPDAQATTVDAPSARLNVADRLTAMASVRPHAVALACPRRNSPSYAAKFTGPSRADYATTTFAELDADATRLARGLAAWGVQPGMRLVLLVRPSIEFVTLVFALLRAGAVIVLVDPGLGKRNLIRCLAEVEPDGFVAVPAAQAVRSVLPYKFANAVWNVTVGRRWFWGGLTLGQLRELGDKAIDVALPLTHADDPAAIIFTSGSTGPPKGVLYTQRMFDTQVADIQAQYDLAPGGVDLSCFPLFALFNSAMGVTTVLPDMDFSRPAAADPNKLLAAANDWHATQAFASPAVWRKLAAHCQQTGDRIESLRQVFSCGAPVSADVLRSTLACVAADAQMHTPYGATECLPVATIEAREVLGETAARTAGGAGVCVGRKFDSIDWRVIRITDEPIASMEEAEEVPTGEIGELVVRGPQASPQYVTRSECNAESKINDLRAGRSFALAGVEDDPARSHAGSGPWHRMGDVGWLDDQGRFWYCGRKSQRVETKDGPLFTECAEGIFNAHRYVKCSALVGVGPSGKQMPVIVLELDSGVLGPFHWTTDWEDQLFELLEKYPQTRAIQRLMPRDNLPVDVRHNAKINREALAQWAAKRLPELA